MQYFFRTCMWSCCPLTFPCKHPLDPTWKDERFINNGTSLQWLIYFLLQGMVAFWSNVSLLLGLILFQVNYKFMIHLFWLYNNRWIRIMKSIHLFIHSFNPGEIFNVRAYYFITPWRICDLAKLISFYFDFNGTILNCQITIRLFVCSRVSLWGLL